MNDFDQFERSLAAALRSDADQSLAQFEPATVAHAAMAGAQVRRLRIPGTLHIGPVSTRWAFAAAAVIGVLLISGALLLSQRGQPAIGGPSPTTTVRPSPAAVVGPSPTPSPTLTPLLWTEAGLKEDWPAPVRPEPVGEAILLPFSYEMDAGPRIVPDPLGDTGSDGHPWVDIRVVDGNGSKFFIELVDNHPPLVDPTEQWIAYGVVVDDDRDGIPDWRYGIDNLPVEATGERPHRAWRTNLHTGRTEADAGPPYDLDTLHTYSFDTFYPPGGYGPEGARISFGGDLAGGGTDPGLVDPFYAWASVIVDGRVVATDYVPDVGWLDPTLR